MDHVELIYREHINVGPLRDRHMLESAVGAPFQTWEGADLYPTVDVKAACLLNGIQRNQPYVDGNKRLAWLSTMVMLNLHKLEVVGVSEQEAADLVLGLANRRISETGAAKWILDHTTDLPGGF